MIITDNPRNALKELEGQKVESKIRFRAPESNLSIEYINKLTLNGKLKQQFSKVADGSIITLFDKTPYPQQAEDVVCPHFVELKWANGCNFDCSWCYLNGTLRFRPMGKKPYLKDLDKINDHLINYLEQVKTPSILNSGELSDSLAYESNGLALTNYSSVQITETT